LCQLVDHLEDVDFLVGDMNSLYLPDYTETEIDRINFIRKRSDWPLAEGKVVETICSLGFVVSPFTGNTSRFQTRIDYIFCRNCIQTKQNIIDTIKTKVSDHNMVIATIL
jgi:endonuclease/exonuclease/phosphatase family metal-dependent hydrolase